MKVLLVQPPIEDFYDTSIRTYPLSLLYLGARVCRLCDVEVADFRSNRKPRSVAQPFAELKPFYRSDTYTPFSLFRNYRRFGLSAPEMAREIAERKPDVLCISSLFSAYGAEALEVARVAKTVNPETVTVLGGTHPTLFPELILADPSVDFVIRGEGETPLFALISALKSGRDIGAARIDGLCHKESEGYSISGIHVEGDINDIPARSLIDGENYKIGGKRYTFLLTSRGCPNNCAFCGKPPVPYRRRTLESIEREIEDCKGLKIEAVDFEDDMLNPDAPFFREILALFEGQGFQLSAMNGIYSERLDRESLEAMYGAGFRRLNFSLVDISGKVIRAQGRAFSQRLVDLLGYLEASPFFLEVHFIIGLPGQTPEDILKTVIFLMGQRVLLGPSLFYLAPASRLFKELSKGRGCRQEDLKTARSSFMLPADGTLPRPTLYTAMKLVRFVNFVKETLDFNGNMTHLDDLLQLPPIRKDERTSHIISALLREKQFIWYNKRENAFEVEPQNRDLIRAFFASAEGKRIKGFKTANSMLVS